MAAIWYPPDRDASHTGPCTHAAAVTPHDTNELAYVSRQLYVGTGGDLKVTLFSGAAVTYPGVPDGAVLDIAARLVWSTGTTASDIVANF